MTDVLILGAGPAGLTAAIYACRAGLSVQVFDKNFYGGQTILTSEVDNFPGMQGVSGPDFAESLYKHATSQGAEVKFEEVTSLELHGETKSFTTSGGTYTGRAVILAMGAARRQLGVPGEAEFFGRGVSVCATCDGAFFRDKDVAIVGGGDTALDDALYLSNNSKNVYLIHRRNAFRGERIKQEKVKAASNVHILYSTTVQSVNGMDHVQSLTLNTPEGEKQLNVDGLFVAVGLVPESRLLAGQISLDDAGYVPSNESCTTGLPGVYVAGDLRNKPLRQIVTAAADGAVAAVAAADYLTALSLNLCTPPAPESPA